MTAVSVRDLELPKFSDAVADRDEMLQQLREAREQHWLAKAPMGYIIVRYEDVVATLRDQRFHSASASGPPMPGDTDGYLQKLPKSIVASEGDAHTRLRRLVSPAFTPKAADALRPFMRDTLNRLIDPLSERGRGELFADICVPYPVQGICELLGAPGEDWQLFSDWATDVFRKYDGNLERDLPLIKRAHEELGVYVRAMIDERRQAPRGDLLSQLIAAEEQGDRLTNAELVTMVETILTAGTDTTRNQLGSCIAILTEHPEQWKLLGEHPELAPQAVEECMRYVGSLRGTLRLASEDIVYRDVLFPQGTLVFTSAVGANMDPEMWELPETFDITKKRDTPQLTFAWGIHFCLGASLARAELQEALVLLSRRMPDLGTDAPVEWKPSRVGIWGPSKLPLHFRPDVP